MVKYTFTFGNKDEAQFRSVLSRLDDSEYNIIEEMILVKPDEPRYSDKQMVIEMDPDACLTFRLGMKQLKIRRERTEEELAAEKELDDRHKVRVTIHVPMSSPPTK
jgi:hypothetical protein